jgi:hypothetical protein
VSKYGTPVGAGFIASTPDDRARWLFDTIRQFEPDVQRVLGDMSDGDYNGWHPFKNEPYERAFLRMVAKLVAASRDDPT